MSRRFRAYGRLVEDICTGKSCKLFALLAKGFYGNHRLNITVAYNKPCTGDSGYRDGWSTVYVLENSVKYLCYWERGFMVITD